MNVRARRPLACCGGFGAEQGSEYSRGGLAGQRLCCLLDRIVETGVKCVVLRRLLEGRCSCDFGTR